MMRALDICDREAGFENAQSEKIKRKITSTNDWIVLIVEDHDFQRHMIARMLRSMNFREVLEAADGKQALTLIRSGTQIDLVVCDLDMPEMDGMELIRHLGEVNSQVSVIISSGKSKALLNSVEKMAIAYNVNLIGAIEKPMTPELLSERISRHLPPKDKPEFTSKVAHNFSLEQIMYGIQQKQFEPFFQPQTDLATGEIKGAEALARWHHPEQGVVGPYAFIPTLEQSGNINELTLLMLEKSASACRNWRERGFNMMVSVNLSLVSLTDTRIADHITQIVRSTGLDPSHMTLEITETASMTEVASALENLTRLRMHGFGLAVDDYGTGFSNLRQLTRIPFTELKIDQSIITGCANDPTLLSIIQSNVEMAHRLNIRSVAEGVETEAERYILRATHCDMAQGYFIAKPMEKSSFLAFCTSGGSSIPEVAPLSCTT